MADKYFEGIGRRKTAVARVRLVKGAGKQMVNDKDVNDYFETSAEQKIATEAYEHLPDGLEFAMTVKVSGGGKHSQAEAVRHGIARAVEKYDEELRKPMKDQGFLKRDSRAKERRKFGLKKARKSPQWSKR